MKGHLPTEKQEWAPSLNLGKAKKLSCPQSTGILEATVGVTFTLSTRYNNELNPIMLVWEFSKAPLV